MQPHVFRRAMSADAPAVRELTRAAYLEWVPVIGREPKPMTADYERAVAEHIIDLYEIAGRLVGLIEMIPEPPHLSIENIAVAPDLHGKGIGDDLLGHAEAIARALGFQEMRLYTNAKFATNIAFYEKRGFVEFLREPVPSGDIAVHMKKAIDMRKAIDA